MDTDGIMAYFNASGVGSGAEFFDDENITTNRVLPTGTIAFAPFIFAEFIIAILSNSILMALIIKARKVMNNTNVYLFSLTIVGLMESFSLFTLLVTVIARRWILGEVMCFVNDFFLQLSIHCTLLFHAVISHNRYLAVLKPLDYWQTYRLKKSVVVSGIIWSTGLILPITSTLIHVFKDSPASGDAAGLGCFDTIDYIQRKVRLMLVSTIVIATLYLCEAFVVTVTSLVYYIRVFKELHIVGKVRKSNRALACSQAPVFKVNGRDKPLNTSTEERAAKSLAVMFLFQLICYAISSIVALTHLIKSLVESRGDGEIEVPTRPEVLLLLVIFFLPATSPAILIIINKRFRNRVKDLFKCELSPETDSAASYKKLVKEEPKTVSPKQSTAEENTVIGKRETDNIQLQFAEKSQGEGGEEVERNDQIDIILTAERSEGSLRDGFSITLEAWDDADTLHESPTLN